MVRERERERERAANGFKANVFTGDGVQSTLTFPLAAARIHLGPCLLSCSIRVTSGFGFRSLGLCTASRSRSIGKSIGADLGVAVRARADCGQSDDWPPHVESVCCRSPSWPAQRLVARSSLITMFRPVARARVHASSGYHENWQHSGQILVRGAPRIERWEFRLRPNFGQLLASSTLVRFGWDVFRGARVKVRIHGRRVPKRNSLCSRSFGRTTFKRSIRAGQQVGELALRWSASASHNFPRQSRDRAAASNWRADLKCGSFLRH